MPLEFDVFNLVIKSENKIKYFPEFSNKNTLSFKKGNRKIYIVCKDKEVLYVGMSKTSVSQRFHSAFRSFSKFKAEGIAQAGYKGYKWIEKIKKAEVYVAIFDESYNDDEMDEFVKAVEGEIAFLIRQKTGKWPLHQNEIHFSNQDGALGVAMDILTKFELN
jgi:hypothetical protein